jgi:hypothetical protein
MYLGKHVKRHVMTSDISSVLGNGALFFDTGGLRPIALPKPPSQQSTLQPPPTRCKPHHLTSPVTTLTVASTHPLRPPLLDLAADSAIRAHCLGDSAHRRLDTGLCRPAAAAHTHSRPPLPPIPPKCTPDAARRAAGRPHRRIGMSSTMSSPWTTSTWWSQMASVRTTPGKRTSVIVRIRPYVPPQHTTRTTRT